MRGVIGYLPVRLAAHFIFIRIMITFVWERYVDPGLVKAHLTQFQAIEEKEE